MASFRKYPKPPKTELSIAPDLGDSLSEPAPSSSPQRKRRLSRSQTAARLKIAFKGPDLQSEMDSYSPEAGRLFDALADEVVAVFMKGY